MVRTKVVAVLLGPSGVGLVGLYISITALVSTIAQLGVDQSGVREVAKANSSSDPEGVAHVLKALRRLCWCTGLLGWSLTIILAWPLSKWTFGDPERMWAVAILGVTVLIGSLNNGQIALLRGMRCIGDLARIQILSALVSTLISIGIYASVGERGIVPVIILSMITQLGISWNFSRKIKIPDVDQDWHESFKKSKKFIGLGCSLMYGGLLAVVIAVVIRSRLIQEFGIETNGIYQSVLGISGMFGGFILGAMGADFYPRLTSVINNNDEVTRHVNEQTEVGILLALPGLVGSFIFAPYLVQIFYSSEFMAGADLLPLFLFGVYGQILTWPVGYIQKAKGATKLLFLNQTVSQLSYLILALALMPGLGLRGLAISFICWSVVDLFISLLIGRYLSDYRWSRKVWFLIIISSVFIAASNGILAIENHLIANSCRVILILTVSLFSLLVILKTTRREVAFKSFFVKFFPPKKTDLI